MSDDQNSGPGPTRAITVWLNIAFAVVLIGILVGASSQPWFLIVAIIWVSVGASFVQRSRRTRRGPPNLFDDESR